MKSDNFEKIIKALDKENLIKVCMEMYSIIKSAELDLYLLRDAAKNQKG